MTSETWHHIVLGVYEHLGLTWHWRQIRTVDFKLSLRAVKSLFTAGEFVIKTCEFHMEFELVWLLLVWHITRSVGRATKESAGDAVARLRIQYRYTQLLVTIDSDIRRIRLFERCIFPRLNHDHNYLSVHRVLEDRSNLLIFGATANYLVNWIRFKTDWDRLSRSVPTIVCNTCIVLHCIINLC